MPELLKTLYVFQSLDLASFFLRGGIACCARSGVARGWGYSREESEEWVGGGAIGGQIVSVFPPPVAGSASSAKMAFYSLSMLSLPLKGYFC